MNIFILTMVFLVNQGDVRPAVASINQEYTSMEKCNAAKEANRAALTTGKVILATCTAR